MSREYFEVGEMNGMKYCYVGEGKSHSESEYNRYSRSREHIIVSKIYKKVGLMAIFKETNNKVLTTVEGARIIWRMKLDDTESIKAELKKLNIPYVAVGEAFGKLTYKLKYLFTFEIVRTEFGNVFHRIGAKSFNPHTELEARLAYEAPFWKD